jgi:cation-transporting ATPase E
MTINGLDRNQVEERRSRGLDNKEITPPTKTVGQIFKTNILTYFNAVFILLALFAISAGAWEKLTFMGIVISNTTIGIVQELRSKRELDKMALLTEQKCTVIREGTEQTVGVHDTVKDDVVVFRAGSQIFADAVIIDGDVVANEALITGEADEIPKRAGDELISGSSL